MVEVQPFLRDIAGVDVFCWNPARDAAPLPGPRLVNNFGDLLGPHLIERLLPPSVSTRSRHKGSRVRLLSVGSVLHFAQEGSVVWGSGVNFKVKDPLPTTAASLDVRAVRGPLTALCLHQAGARVPHVFGDPALLLPLVMPELREMATQKRFGTLVVPNLNDLTSVQREAESLGLNTLNPTAPLGHVLRTLAQAEFVVGTSLHAVVIADALGIPARFVRSGVESPLKYRDYLAGTSRGQTRIADNLREAVSLGGHEAPVVDLDALLDSFPRDLWFDTPPRDDPPAFAPAPSLVARWAEAMAETPPTLTTVVGRFVGEQMPDLLTMAGGLLDNLAGQQPEPTDPAMAEFARAFSEAAAVRRDLLPDLDPAVLEERVGRAVRCLDTGQPEALLRQTWLYRVGPHAIVRRTRRSSRGVVLSIAVRPGDVRNELGQIAVRFRSEGDTAVVTSRAAVFDTHREQWSIDVAVGLRASELQGASRWRAEVVLQDRGGGELVVLPVGTSTISLLAFPTEFSSLPPWELTTAASPVERVPDGTVS